MAGCSGRAPADRESLARCLPAGISLSTQLDGHGITVEQKLTELGARPHDGKLVDASGKEIYFLHRITPGADPGPEGEKARRKAEEEELNRLREKYTVIVIITPGV